MAEKIITRYQGLVVQGFQHEDLAAKGATATDSKYTQAGPAPGVPEPSVDGGLVLASGGVQAEDGELEVLIKRAGVTGAEEAGFLWRDVAAGDTATQYKGWDPYHVITGWHSIVATTSTSLWEAWHVDAIQLQNGSGLYLTAQSVGSRTVRLDSFNPSTSTWTQISGPTLAYICSGGGLVQLPSGLVLLFLEAQSQTQIDVWASADDGATWSEYSLACLRTDLSNSNQKQVIKVGYSGGDLSLIVQDLSGTDEWWQYASDDDGTRFSLVDAGWGVAGSDIAGCDLIGLPDGGGFVMSYYVGAGASPYNYSTRKIVSAWDAFASATEASLAPQGGGPAAPPSQAASTIWQDEDGALYVGVVNTSGVRAVLIMRSTDEAATWAHIGNQPIQHASDANPHSFAAIAIAGRVGFVTRWTSTGSSYDPYSVACIWLGGYGTHTVPAASDVSAHAAVWGAFSDGSHIAWDDADSGGDGGQWLPIDLPGSNWTLAGAGSLALNASGNATFTDARTYFGASSGAANAVFAEFIAEVTTGTAALKLRLVDDPASATTLYEVSVNLGASNLRLYDENAAATVGTTVTGLASGPWRVRVAMDGSGAVRTWYAQESHVTTWTEGPEATGLTSSASNVDNRCVFGSPTTGGNVEWKFTGYCFWPYRWSPEDLSTQIGSHWENPDSLHPRSVPGQATTVSGGTKLRGIGGIARKGDSYRIAARYDHGVSLLFPDVEPSPARGWRSSALTEHLFVFDRESVTYTLGADRSYLESTALGIFFLRANFKAFYVEAYNTGTTTWDVLGTADASDGLASLGFTRNGSRVRPNGATATASRYLFNSTHIGDTFDLGTGEDADRYRKIKANTEGAWTTSTARTPVIGLDGMTGDEVATGTGAIWCRDFGIVIHDLTGDYERYRVRIPAQATADGYLQGTLHGGPVFPFGSQYDQRWTIAKERRYRDTELPSGRRRRKPLGPVRRVAEIGWNENAVDASRAYGSQATALGDYIVPGATEAGANVADTVSQVEGLVEMVGSSPVILLRRVASGHATVKVNLRESFLYGRIVSNGTQQDAVLGDEVLTPMDRLNTIRIEEEV